MDTSFSNNNQAEEYSYYAFISYSRKDEKWAKWLQKKIENYRLPAVIRKENVNCPASVKPIFRDKTDLSVGMLANSLQEELRRSKYLIVICSPNSAKSEWVDREIQSFMRMGRADRIIPVIISGNPNSPDPNEQCFPPSLLSKEILGVNLHEVGKTETFLRVISGLLNLRLDKLRSRHSERLRRQKMRRGIIAGIFSVILIIGGYLSWYNFIPQEAYFVDYVTVYGVPKGLYPLSKDQVKKRYESYLIISRGGKVRELKHVNSQGTITDYGHTERLDRPVHAKYFYKDDKSGKLASAEFFDTTGRTVLIQEYSASLTSISFRQQNDSLYLLSASTTGQTTGMMNLNDPIHNNTKKSDIVRHDLVYDDEGHVIKVLYRYDERGTPVSDADGVAGLQYELDDMGRITNVVFLGEDEKPIADKHNIAGKKYGYDDHGNLTRTEFFDPSGEPTRNQMGWMIAASAFDDNGNVTTEWILNGDDQAAYSLMGYAIATFKYDENGNRIRYDFWSPSGLFRVMSSDGFAAQDIQYDKYGRPIKLSYYGTDDKPVRLYLSYCSLSISYDKKGRISAQAYLDEEGKPVASLQGFYKTGFMYDDEGSLSGIRYYFIDDDGNPETDWRYESRNTYDSLGCLTEYAFFDQAGNPVLDVNGVSRVVQSFDKLGNLEKTEYFGTDGKPVIDKYQTSKIVYSYDDKENSTRTMWLGTDGSRVPMAGGTNGYVFNRNEFNQVTSWEYFGVNDEPANCLNGYAKNVFTFSREGYVTGIAYFDADGKPVKCQDGFASCKTDYDKRGNKTLISLFDENGALITGSNGFAEYRAEYDDKGRLTKETYLGPDLELKNNNNNYAVYTAEYDDYSDPAVNVESFLDSEGNPTNVPSGFARKETTVNKNGHIVSIRYFNSQGEEVTDQFQAK